MAPLMSAFYCTYAFQISLYYFIYCLWGHVLSLWWRPEYCYSTILLFYKQELYSTAVEYRCPLVFYMGGGGWCGAQVHKKVHTKLQTHTQKIHFWMSVYVGLWNCVIPFAQCEFLDSVFGGTYSGGFGAFFVCVLEVFFWGEFGGGGEFPQKIAGINTAFRGPFRFCPFDGLA